jgi:hypothetical protein
MDRGGLYAYVFGVGLIGLLMYQTANLLIKALSTGPSSPVMSTMWFLMVTVSIEAYRTPETKALKS